MKNKTIALLIILLAFSCQKQSNNKLIFLKEIKLIKDDFTVNKDDLGRIEGIQCNDSFLITWDYHSGQSFSLFDSHTGKHLGRFGDIGQGPTEIPLPCGGYIIQNKYKIFSCSTGFIAQYDLDSLYLDINKKPQILCRKVFTDDFFLSATVPINDSLYFGAGVYASKNQYVLFDKKGQIVDASVLIYNAYNDLFDKSLKILSNQGRMTKSPNANKYAFFINNSSNIDFVEVTNNKINILKLLRERDPIYTPVQEGSMKMVYPDRKSAVGYIDITSGENYVYALYSDNTIEKGYNSNIVHVFDWNGSPKKKYILTKEAYYITIDEINKRLYAAIREKDGGWNIIAYNIDNP